MIYRVALALGLLLLTGCTPDTGSSLGPGDRPLRPVYVINPADAARDPIQCFRWCQQLAARSGPANIDL